MKRHRIIGWSTALALCLGVVSLALAVRGCGPRTDAYNTLNFPLSRTVDDPASADSGSVDLVGARDFRFIMGDGSGWHGYNVIKIGADGKSEYTFSYWVQGTDSNGSRIQTQHWKCAEFSVDAGTLAELRKLLAEVNFFKLKKEYDANVEDGTQRWIKVEASGKRKGVYCNNHFPQVFMRIYGFVNDRIIAAHPVEIGAAQEIELHKKDMEPESYP
jgi:hypothetical protein